MLARMLDEDEFLSPYGLRTLSRQHLDKPFTVSLGGQDFTVGYEPAESTSGLFGGNSNWRGPIWLPTNFLLVVRAARVRGVLRRRPARRVPDRLGHQADARARSPTTCPGG